MASQLELAELNLHVGIILDNNNKQQKIVQMFDDIAGTYDTANRVLSWASTFSGERPHVMKLLHAIANP